MMNTLHQKKLMVGSGSSIGSDSSNRPMGLSTTVARGTRLVQRLSKLQPPSQNHRSRAPLTVGLPPSSLASVALTNDQAENAENSDLLVENMLRALIHMDTTPRSDVSSPLSPTVLAFDLSAGRVAAFAAHTSPAHCPWERASEWGSDGAQVLGSQDSPTTVVRRRLAAIRCASASPKRRPSPYLRQSAATGPARVNHHHRMQTLRFSPLHPRSPNPATAGGAARTTRLSWAHGGEQDLVLRQGRVMAL